MADRYLITHIGVQRWRAIAGQRGVDAWCRLHRLDPTKVALSPGLPVVIADGWITGSVYREDKHGHRYLDGDAAATASFARQLVASPPPQALEVQRVARAGDPDFPYMLADTRAEFDRVVRRGITPIPWIP